MISPEWPPLPFPEWEKTYDTLHMWTQIVGKTRMALSSRQNHWWHVALYVTPRGLNTSSIPFGKTAFDVDLDFIAHRLSIRTSDGREYGMALAPRSVEDFYAEYMAALRALGIEVHFSRTPEEFDDPTPYDEDRHHASYDAASVEAFRRVLVSSDRILKQFRSRFVGKCSPVHFFWGSFDLAVTRFCGRPAPVPDNADPITREAYSHEVISCGFWPGDRRFKFPAFYAYCIPAPAGFESEAVRPKGAGWDRQLGEFILKYDDVRSAESPGEAILGFCQSTYEAGARLAKWDRAALERDA